MQILNLNLEVQIVPPDLASKAVFNITQYASPTLENNLGFGTTTPDAWSSDESTRPYFQFRFKILAPTANPGLWTPANLSNVVSWCEGIENGDGYFQMYADPSSQPSAGFWRVSLQINMADTANNWANSTTNQRPIWDETNNYLSFTSTGTRHFIAGSTTPYLAMEQVDVHAVLRRPATTNTAIAFAVVNTANSNDRVVCVWLPSNHATAPNMVAFAIWDAAANVSLYGTALTGTNFAYVTWRFHVEVSPGVFENQLFFNGVQQTITVISGSNTGQTFTGATTANDVRRARIQGGTVTPLAVRDSTHDEKFFMICPSSQTNFTETINYLDRMNLD